MRSSGIARLALAAYLLIFFSYLLGPLVIMSLTAFNTASFPSISPWACFTFNWFQVLFNDQHIRDGIYYSVIIGIGTVILSVAMGMAASIVLTQVWPRLRSTYYTMIIAPILIPGVVLGISTLVFWDRVGKFLGAPDGSLLDQLFHNGIFLTILGQSAFIASYAMLVFVARLQRFDPGLTEAALDLGASHTQAFRKILLPFMRPAIASASVLAFLASFENYNTTTFTILDYKTLTTVLAQKVRLGINPSVSALAVLIITLTVFAALAYGAWQKNQSRREAAKQAGRPRPAFFRGNVSAVALVLLSFVVIVMVGTAQSYDPAQCIKDYRAERQAEIQKRIEELRKKQEARQPAQSTAPAPAAGTGDKAPSSGAFGGVFAPGNLGGEAPATAAPKPAEPAKPATPFGNVFAPSNLGGEAPKTDTPKTEAPAKPANPFGSAFTPDNLKSGN